MTPAHDSNNYFIDTRSKFCMRQSNWRQSGAPCPCVDCLVPRAQSLAGIYAPNRLPGSTRTNLVKDLHTGRWRGSTRLDRLPASTQPVAAVNLRAVSLAEIYDTRQALLTVCYRL